MCDGCHLQIECVLYEQHLNSALFGAAVADMQAPVITRLLSKHYSVATYRLYIYTYNII